MKIITLPSLASRSPSVCRFAAAAVCAAFSFLRPKRIILLCAVALVSRCGVCAKVFPVDDGRVLRNPDMGWTMQYYSNVPYNYGSTISPGDAMEWFPGCTVCYLRIPWAYLEPEEGKFNWAALDTPAQRWIERGGQIAFRITCSESWLPFATPKWVKEAGAKGVFYDFGPKGGVRPDGKNWDPDFADPIFLEKLENFLRAMSARYDGRREVAFMDVGTYGTWGEGHTGWSSRIPDAEAWPVVKRHIDMHRRLFPRTQLVISDDVAGSQNPDPDPDVLSYARAKGVGWRDDSIMVSPKVPWFHVRQAERFWRTLPIVLEHEHYEPAKKKCAWSGELLVKSVEDHHASYMSIHGNPRLILDENRAAIDRINRRMGYRLRLMTASWPDEIAVGAVSADVFRVSWTWGNAGVAPCYRGGFPCLTVKDANGGIIAVLADRGLDVRKLPVSAAGKTVGVSHEASFCLGRWQAPVFRSGVFDVYVSVGEADGTPTYELPLPDSDGHRRYRIGKVRFNAQ